MKLDFKKGQSMIEVVAGLAVATLLAVALISTTVYTQKLSRNAKNNTQAAKLAQEAIEQIRVVRDRQGFDYFAARNDASGQGSKIDTSAWTLNAPAACPAETIPTPAITGETSFGRCITVQNGNDVANEKKITVTINWTESSGPQSVVDVTYLSRPCIKKVGSGAPTCP